MEFTKLPQQGTGPSSSQPIAQHHNGTAPSRSTAAGVPDTPTHALKATRKLSPSVQSVVTTSPAAKQPAATVTSVIQGPAMTPAAPRMQKSASKPESSSARPEAIASALGEEQLRQTLEGKPFLRDPVSGEAFFFTDRQSLPELRRRIKRAGLVQPKERALKIAIELLAGQAAVAPHMKVIRRVGLHEDKWYYDTCAGTVIEITPGAWSAVDAATLPVAFDRHGLVASAIPKAKGSPEAFWRALGIGAAEDAEAARLRMFVTCVMLAALRPTQPWPIVALIGGAGSGKTTLAHAIKRILDPSTPMARIAPSGIEDLALALSSSHVSIFDNCSSLPVRHSALLCTHATGSAHFAVRQRFTLNQEQTTAGSGITFLTSVTPVVRAPDLASRTWSFEVEGGRTRRTSLQIESEVEAAAPAMLGSLFDAAAAARCAPAGPAKGGRMHEAIGFVAAGAAAAGFSQQAVLDLFQELEADAAHGAAESMPWIEELAKLLVAEGGSITCTMSELRARLSCMARSGLPDTVAALRSAFVVHKRQLELLGFTVEHLPRAAKQRKIRFSYADPATRAAASAPAPITTDPVPAVLAAGEEAK